MKSIKLACGRSVVLRVLTIILLLVESAFCQSTKPSPWLESVDIQAARSGDQVVTLGILPNENIQFRNTTLKKIIAAAYNVDEDLVTGGPDWLNSDRFDIAAKAPPGASQAERLARVQTLLAERFKLAVHHDKKIAFVYALGKYELAPGAIFTITHEGSHLFAQLSNQPKFQLFPEDEKDFFLKVVDAQITFVTDAQGRATELILHQGGDQNAKRIE